MPAQAQSNRVKETHSAADWHWLRSLVSPVRGLLREVLGLSLFINALALAVPIFVLQVYDRVIFHAGIETLTALLIGMAIVLTFEFVLRQARAKVLQAIALRIDIRLGRALSQKLARLPLRTLESRPTPYWQALYRDAEFVRNAMSGVSALTLFDLPYIPLFLALIFTIARPIAFVLVAALGCYFLLGLVASISVTKASNRERLKAIDRDSTLAEMAAGRATIKALAMQPALEARLEARQADSIDAALVRGGRSDRFANLSTTMSMATTVLLVSVGAFAVIDQQMTIGALVASTILANRFVGPLVSLVSGWRSYSGFATAAKRVAAVLDEPEEPSRLEITAPRPHGRLEAEQVTFEYGEANAPVVAGLTFRLGPGGLHGIVGPNGSGKTTLLKLIQGLYTPSSGRILLDGADIAQFGRTQLADWIGYAPQECFLLAGSIRDNLAIRRPEESDEEILAAARRAGLHAAVSAMPDGYGTDVGEAGAQLSGGQRQRIVIARAMVGDPPILILDEPTSNIDREAKAGLRESLLRLATDHTIIVATHSTALLAACTSVMLIQAGKIAAAGPPDQVFHKMNAAASHLKAVE